MSVRAPVVPELVARVEALNRHNEGRIAAVGTPTGPDIDCVWLGHRETIAAIGVLEDAAMKMAPDEVRRTRALASAERARAHQQMAWYFARVGRVGDCLRQGLDALEAYDRATALDPTDAVSPSKAGDICRIFLEDLPAARDRYETSLGRAVPGTPTHAQILEDLTQLRAAVAREAGTGETRAAASGGLAPDAGPAFRWVYRAWAMVRARLAGDGWIQSRHDGCADAVLRRVVAALSGTALEPIRGPATSVEIAVRLRIAGFRVTDVSPVSVARAVMGGHAAILLCRAGSVPGRSRVIAELARRARAVHAVAVLADERAGMAMWFDSSAFACRHQCLTPVALAALLTGAVERPLIVEARWPRGGS